MNEKAKAEAETELRNPQDVLPERVMLSRFCRLLWISLLEAHMRKRHDYVILNVHCLQA